MEQVYGVSVRSKCMEQVYGGCNQVGKGHVAIFDRSICG